MGFLRGLRLKLGLRKQRPTDIWPWQGIHIGRHTYGVTRDSIGGYDETIGLSIGSFCSVAGAHFFIRGNHKAGRVTTFPIENNMLRLGRGIDELEYERPIEIGNDVWIGLRAMIMPGVKIGHGAIIGAASVVTHDIPPYAVAVGAPARVVKYRFPPETVERLLEIRWWDWPDDEIIAKRHLLLTNPDELLRVYNADVAIKKSSISEAV